MADTKSDDWKIFSHIIWRIDKLLPRERMTLEGFWKRFGISIAELVRCSDLGSDLLLVEKIWDPSISEYDEKKINSKILFGITKLSLGRSLFIFSRYLHSSTMLLKSLSFCILIFHARFSFLKKPYYNFDFLIPEKY